MYFRKQVRNDVMGGVIEPTAHWHKPLFEVCKGGKARQAGGFCSATARISRFYRRWVGRGGS